MHYSEGSERALVTMVEPENVSIPEDEPQQQMHRSIGGNRKQINASKIVLIVDDDPDLLDVTSFALEGEGFGIETARHGEEALQLLRAGNLPAVVLLDLMMPIMNGWQFLEEVARVPSLKEIPVVVLTAAGVTEVPGAVEVLHKPIDLRLLTEVVDRYVHRAG
jgi:CheY-like chemotaxis protein